jgi:hypothetical protein
VKSLRLNKDIRILRADTGNCTVVLDESEYKDKLNTLLESGVYETLSKDPAAKVERNVQKLLSKYKTTLPTDVFVALVYCDIGCPVIEVSSF